MKPSKENNVEIIDIVNKLIGEIEPVGETHTDEKRLENLKAMTALVDELLEKIAEIAQKENRVEYSIKVCGRHAANFLRQAIEEYNPENNHYI